MRSVILVTAAVAVSGCAQNMEITRAPVEVSKTAGFVTANYVGDDQAVIRSYFAKDKESGQDRTEFAGAACQLKGRGYSASFQTPAIVNLPDYDYYSQPVSGACKIGEYVRPIVLKPYNETVRARTDAAANAGASGGLIGMLAVGIVSGIVESTNDPTDDDWDYADVAVEFPSVARPSGAASGPAS